MLILTQFQATNCLRIINMSSVWTLGSQAADNIAFHRENLEKKIVANMISKYRNFSWFNYYSISSFLHGHDLRRLDNPDPVEWETISNPNPKNSYNPAGLDSKIPIIYTTGTSQTWPVSLFQTPTPLLFHNFWIRVRLFFNFENPTPVQTPATITHPTEIYPWFYQRNDRTDACYCWNGKVTPDPGPVFRKFLTPGPKEKRTFSSTCFINMNS